MITTQNAPTRFERVLGVFRKDYLKSEESIMKLGRKFDLNPLDMADLRQRFQKYKNATEERKLATDYQIRDTREIDTLLANAKEDLASFLVRVFRQKTTLMTDDIRNSFTLFRHIKEMIYLKPLFELVGAARELVGEKKVAQMLERLAPNAKDEIQHRARLANLGMKVAIPVMGLSLFGAMYSFLSAQGTATANAIGPGLTFVALAALSVWIVTQHGLLTMQTAGLLPLLPKESKAKPD